MRQFAEQELILPTGPHAGRRFRVDRNPFAGVLFDAIDSGRWSRVFATGPQQSGKSLLTFVTPILYHLFEMKETVIVGLPTMDMAADKWNEDILPALEQTKYRDLLPRNGAGSKGGTVTRINFRNGRTLRFMSGGGNDKKRSAFTARVLVISETDGMDESGGTSREADKITQLEGRTRAFGDRARVYAECTVSLEAGRTWQEYTNGTKSRILIRCQHCNHYVTPEREHLVGWQDAEDILTAGDKTRTVCPDCGAMWDEGDRIRANHDAKIVHRGQEVTPDGAITGQPVRTNTLGFRWNAHNNLLVSQRVVGEGEWKANRSTDEDNADRAQCQFVWAVPPKDAAVNLTEFDAAAITRRTTTDMKGRVPSWAQRITVGIDLGKWLCHWTATAWGENATPHVIEYGRIEVPSSQMAVETAILTALRDFRDSVIATGWAADGGNRKPTYVFIDCGNWQDTVKVFVHESGQLFWACKGFSDLDLSPGERKRQSGATFVGAGENCALVKLPGWNVPIVEAVADAWKTWLHARLQTPMGQPGAMTLHQVMKSVEHLGFSKHLTAEQKVQEFESGKGITTRWRKVHHNNHWLDSTALSCVAGWWAGERVLGATPPPPPRSATTESTPVTSYGGNKRW